MASRNSSRAMSSLVFPNPSCHRRCEHRDYIFSTRARTAWLILLEFPFVSILHHLLVRRECLFAHDVVGSYAAVIVPQVVCDTSHIHGVHEISQRLSIFHRLTTFFFIWSTSFLNGTPNLLPLLMALRADFMLRTSWLRLGLYRFIHSSP